MIFLCFLLPRQGQLWRLVKGDVVKRRELDEDPGPVGAGEKVFTSVRYLSLTLGMGRSKESEI